jgi:glycosyltransferase involved in cell wall biosynthesis
VLEVVRPFETSLRAAPAWLRAVLLPCSTFVESAVNRGGVPRSSLRVIEHGPDLAHDFAPRREIGDRRPVLMCFGTLDRDHGIDVLIECARLLKQARRELHTVVFGEGPDEGLLRRLARELELSDVLTITSPMLTDVNSALAQADLHVSCARRGNPGWSALQALGLGIPSIFSGLNSTFPLIEDRVDGLLVERNDPRKLVEGITTLLDNPRAAKLMGAKARAKMLAQGRAEQFRRELAELHAEALESTAARVPLGHEGALEA